MRHPPSGQIRSTSPPCSAWTRRPPSVTPTLHEHCWSRQPSNTPLPVHREPKHPHLTYKPTDPWVPREDPPVRLNSGDSRGVGKKRVVRHEVLVRREALGIEGGERPPRWAVLLRLSRMLRGWTAYFKYGCSN